ncbi:N-acetyltransferase family protein [Streptomyces massasporeus]
MSSENLRPRFFAASRRSARLAADRACARVRPEYRALLAETQGRVIGVAEYDAGDQKDEAEVSVVVADGLHLRGVGTLLVEHLVSAALVDGITTGRRAQ